MKYEVVPSKVTQGHWYVDRTRNGQTESIAIFLTVDAETQAREYARFMEEKSTERELCPLCKTHVLGYCAQGEYCTNDECTFVA